jgi:hypothetical protein
MTSFDEAARLSTQPCPCQRNPAAITPSVFSVAPVASSLSPWMPSFGVQGIGVVGEVDRDPRAERGSLGRVWEGATAPLPMNVG